ILPPPRADVVLTKIVNRRRVPRGRKVIFTLVVSNNGPNRATGVVMSDVLPRGLRFVSAAPSQGTYDPGSRAWAVGTLAVGGRAVLQIVALAQGVGVRVNTGRVSALEADPNLSNNVAAARLTMMRSAASISKRFFLSRPRKAGARPGGWQPFAPAFNPSVRTPRT